MPTYVMQSNLPDPWLLVAECFSKWIRIRILMVLSITWLLINIGMSVWLSLSSAGDLDSITLKDGTVYSNSNWSSSICNSSPYVYLRPFSFTFTYHGTSSTNSTTCGFQSTNSIIRYVIGSIGIVATIILFFKTPLSIIARQIWSTLALLYFVVFVLDCYTTEVGTYNCGKSFPNTSLNNELTANGITLSCSNSNYAGLAVIDFISVFLFAVIHSAWALAKDLYVIKK